MAVTDPLKGSREGQSDAEIKEHAIGVTTWTNLKKYIKSLHKGKEAGFTLLGRSLMSNLRGRDFDHSRISTGGLIIGKTGVVAIQTDNEPHRIKRQRYILADGKAICIPD